MKNIAYIGLSSNLGCTFSNLDKAINLLKAEPTITVLSMSKRYYTNPVGVWEDMPDFLNQVLKLSYSGPGPKELLFDILFKIEDQLGRARIDKTLYGPQPRTLDLDLLLYNNEKWDLPELTIPHVRMFERAFVLVPLLEICDDSVELPGQEQCASKYLKQCLNKINFKLFNNRIEQDLHT